MVPFVLLLPEARGDFPPIFTVGMWSSSWRLISQYCGDPCDWVPLEFSTLRAVPTESLAVGWSQFRFSYTSTGSRGSFFSWVSAPVSLGSLCSPVCLSNLAGSGLPCVLPSLRNPRMMTPHMQNWKPEVSVVIIFSVSFISALLLFPPFCLILAFLFLFLFFLAVPRDLRDLSPSTRDWTWALGSESTES